MQGREVVEHMLRASQLERVTASREHADYLIEQAWYALETAKEASSSDPRSAYCALYDAARLAMTAILENQGLRPTISGGHVAVYEAVLAQLDPPEGRKIRPFNEMRRIRHSVEYPAMGVSIPSPADVREACPQVETIIGMAEQVLDSMPVF